ncbi:hypothetical protein KCQ_05241 [Pectobacterium atrosepticum ICMP 1526]|uniref:hypothetical protein n=1 Tax=Pectobacterium atrosepticum TaxID=29471 RepID=UPI000505EA79|nr:hypothetical protein [Pectobacterium atrosepticum]KFX11061.1 hypothetical protein JV34_21700 [Pectobacterium atrosepticum]KMK87618.1 hypothetical protein KCQ_05241 [Pectobacterium atrosepticum ICMP 1526]QXE13096.1 hypothetical protein DCX48_00470 [Pectobacterium atrosepticum]
MTNTFKGTVLHTAHVMTSISEVVFFGVLFSEQDEWFRVATDDIRLAESLAFLQPGDRVQLGVKGTIVQVSRTYHRLVSVERG